MLRLFASNRRVLRPTRPDVNWAHPLARGLKSCLIPLFPGLLVDLAKIRPKSSSSSAARGAMGQSVSGIWNIGTGTDTTDLNWTSGPFTCMAFCNLPANANGVYVDVIGRTQYVAEGNNNGWGIQMRAADDANAGYNFLVFNNGTGGQYICKSSFSTVAGDQMLVGTADGSTRKAIWTNLNKTSSTSASLVPATCSAAMAILNTGTSKLYVAYTWFRELTDAEITSMFYAPFSLISYPAEDRAGAQLFGTATGGGGGGFKPAFAIGRNYAGDGVAT